MANVITSSARSVFIQRYLGAVEEYLGDYDKNCVNLDSIPSPTTSYDPIHCKDARGKIVVIGKKQSGGPDLIDLSVEQLLFPAASILEKLRLQECDFIMHALTRCEGRAGVFSNHIRSNSVMGVQIVDDQISNVLQRDADDESMHNFDLNALPPRIDTWALVGGLKTTAETEDINSLHSFDSESCGACGAPAYRGTTWVAVADGDGAATPPNALFSFDYGNTWAAAASPPFATFENLTAVRMFQVGASTVRTLATRSTIALSPLEVYYSDDYGATAWTAVTVGATNGEFVAGHEGLWVLDEQHIWLVTDQGNVYFSSNGGATFAVQSSALVASGGNALNSVVFLDSQIGFAVGDADTVIYTTDGGVNWTAANATGGAGNLLAMWPVSEFFLLVGDDAGALYGSWDRGVTWEQLDKFTGSGTGSITSIWFVNDLVGFMTHIDAAGDGRILRTISSGRSWNRLDGSFGDAGLNAVFPIFPNVVFAVGDDDGTTGVILQAGTF